MAVSPAQKRMLRHIDRWGELGPDAEDEVRVYGAAFEAVFAAVERRQLVERKTNDSVTFWLLTDAGRAAIAPAS